MDNVRGGDKVNFMSREVSMGRFGQTVKYPNLNQNGIQPHIGGITGLVKDGVCAILIDSDSPLSGVLLWVMKISSSGGYVLLSHDI